MFFFFFFLHFNKSHVCLWQNTSIFSILNHRAIEVIFRASREILLETEDFLFLNAPNSHLYILKIEFKQIFLRHFSQTDLYWTYSISGTELNVKKKIKWYKNGAYLSENLKNIYKLNYTKCDLISNLMWPVIRDFISNMTRQRYHFGIYIKFRWLIATFLCLVNQFKSTLSLPYISKEKRRKKGERWCAGVWAVMSYIWPLMSHWTTDN